MFDSSKRANGFCDFVGLSSGEARGGYGSENVFEIVRARKRNFRWLQNDFFLALIAENDFFPAKKSALCDALLAAEPKKSWFCGGIGSARGIVGVKHGEIGGGLLFEDACFRRAVRFHRAVTIEMIRREIQKNAYIRTKCFNPFELKTAELGDGNGLVRSLFDNADERRADISRKKCGVAGTFQDVLAERSRGGLSVGAGNANEAAAEKAVGKLDFAPDGNVLRARGREDFGISGDAGAGNDEVPTNENFFRVAAELK